MKEFLFSLLNVQTESLLALGVKEGFFFGNWEKYDRK